MTFSPPVWPVFVKGVILDAERRVLLLRDERGEWELPGRRLEIGNADGAVPADKDPELALERGLLEATGWLVEVGPLIQGGVWVRERPQGLRALIVTYGCRVRTADQVPVVSREQTHSGLFGLDEIGDLNLADGFRRSVVAWGAAGVPEAG